MRLYVIDTETGGVDCMEHSLLSISLVRLEDKKVDGIIEVLVKEDPIILRETAVQINRIDILKHCLIASEVDKALERVIAFLGGVKDNILIGHNVGFDVGFLKRLFRLNNREGEYNQWFSYRNVDTASILRTLYHAGLIDKDISSLDKALKHFKVEIENDKRHTAMGDAMATAQLYIKILDFIEKPSDHLK